MGEILPDGTIQGYTGICRLCKKYIKVNIQGNEIDSHNCKNKPMKHILIDTPKGQYKLDLKLVAEHRADYYAVEVDGHDKGGAEWDDEVEFCMNDDFEGIDWILNNTDWEDWKLKAEKINDAVNVTDDDFWCSSENMEIHD